MERRLAASLTIAVIGTAMILTAFPAARAIVDRADVLSSSAQTTVTLIADADATLISELPDDTFGDDNWLEISSVDEGEHRAATLLRFDLSPLPPDAVIDTAELRLFLEDATGASSVSITAYAVTGDWDESEVTWNTSPTTGAFGVVASIDDAEGNYKDWSITSYAQAWVDDPTTNHGVLLLGPESGAYERWFQSREGMDMVPQLEVTYHLPAYSFSGHVYEGEPEDTSTPMNGVTVELWGDEDEWPEGGADRVHLASTTTSRSGAFSLEWDRATEWPFLHVIEVDPAGTVSKGAAADPPGYVKNYNVVSFRHEDILESGIVDFDGIAFWDEPMATDTPTPTATSAPSDTPTPTSIPTDTPTPTATETPPPPLNVTLCAAQDTWVHQGQATTNYGSDVELSVGNGWGQNEPAISRALMYFDLSWLPPGSTIRAASLELELVDALGSGLIPVDLYAVTDDWDAREITWSDQPPVASTPEAQALVDSVAPAVVIWEVQPLVQDWVDGVRANDGLELRGPETGSLWRRAFESREGAYCPSLILEVEPAGPYQTPTPLPTKTPTPTPTSPCPQPDGAGDSFETATALTTDGSEIPEYLCPSGDVDWWTFHAEFGQDIQLWLFDMPYDYDLILFDPDGVEKDSSERWGAENWEYVSVTSYKEGDWRALVRGKNAGQWSGRYPYKLKGSLRFTCDPDGAGDTFSSATPLTPTLPQTGIYNVTYEAICPQGDVDFYRFYVPSGQTVHITATLTELPANYDMQLHYPTGGIAWNANNPGQSDEMMAGPLSSAMAGEVRLRVYAPGDPGDTAYHNRSYRLEVILTGDADLTVQDLEITQAIQDMDNTLDLAAGKRSVGRVYVTGGPGAGEVTGVQVELHGWEVKIGASYALPGSPLALDWGPVSDDPVENTKRLAYAQSYNFVLPSSWTTSGSKRFQASVNTDRLIPETDINNNDSPREAVFFRSNRTLNIGFVPVKAQGLVPTLQGNPDFSSMLSWFRAVFPAADIQVWYKKGGPLDADYDYTIKGSKGCGSAWARLLSDLDDIYDDWKDRPSNAFVYGLLHENVQHYYPGCGLTPGHAAGGLLRGGMGPTLAHELGHNFGRKHTPSDPWGNPDCGKPANVDSGYPQYTSPQGQSYFRSSIGEVGVNVYNGTTFDPRTHYDLMSYCGPEWISPYNWESILSAMPAAQAASMAGLEVPHLVVKGWLGNGDQVDVRPFWIQDRPEGAHDEPGAGPYRIELRDGQGVILFVRHFDIETYTAERTARPDPDVCSTRTTEGYFREWMPYPAETARILFLHGDQVLHTVQVSPNAPSVTVLQPNGGETWAGDGPFTIAWEANDADGDPLWAHVLYSRDGGETWEPLAVNVEENHIEVSGADMPGSDEALVRVTVTDGVNTSWDTSDDPFEVNPKPPVALLLEPRDGDAFSPAEQVVLAALATDLEDGPIPEGNLSWASDVDGPLGDGNDITVDTLSRGTHQITVTATDSDDMQGSASVRIFVGHRVYLPILLRDKG